MLSFILLCGYIIGRTYYKDLYKAVVWLAVPVLFIIILVVLSGDFAAADTVASAELLLFLCLIFEIFLSRFIKDNNKGKKR